MTRLHVVTLDQGGHVPDAEGSEGTTLQSTTLEGVARELHGLPLEEFTAARDARAKELRTAGDRELARQVAALRRPTTAAWAVNQLVRARRDEVEQLLALGAALQEAQEAFAGEELRELNRQQHRVVAAIRQEARAVAAQAGQRLTEAVGRQVEATLRAGMADPAAAEAVRSGLLTSDLESTGFEPVDLDGAVAVPLRGGTGPAAADASGSRTSRAAAGRPAAPRERPSRRTGTSRPAAAAPGTGAEERREEERRAEEDERRAREEAERREQERRAREVAEAREAVEEATRAQEGAEDRLAEAEGAITALDRRREGLAAHRAELRAALEAAEDDDAAVARELDEARAARERVAREADDARRATERARDRLAHLA